MFSAMCSRNVWFVILQITKLRRQILLKSASSKDKTNTYKEASQQSNFFNPQLIIPKLELRAAWLESGILQPMAHFWTDSSIVLPWANSENPCGTLLMNYYISRIHKIAPGIKCHCMQRPKILLTLQRNP